MDPTSTTRDEGTAEDRRLLLVDEYGEEAAWFAASLRRRREAEARLLPLADLIKAA